MNISPSKMPEHESRPWQEGHTVATNVSEQTESILYFSGPSIYHLYNLTKFLWRNFTRMVVTKMMPKHCLHIVLCSLGLPVILYCDLRNKGRGGINKSISKILYFKQKWTIQLFTITGHLFTFRRGQFHISWSQVLKNTCLKQSQCANIKNTRFKTYQHVPFVPFF